MAKARSVYLWSRKQIGRKDLGRNCTFVWDIVYPPWNCIGDWCAAFLQAGLKTYRSWYDCPLPYYVPSWESDAKKEGNWITTDGRKARFMDAVTFGRTVGSHIEWFLCYLPGGYILTIGGNTSSPTGSTYGGEGVWIKKRAINSPTLPVRGFIRMPWDDRDEKKPFGKRKFPLPRGHWYGDDDGTKFSHSGLYPKDRANDPDNVKRIQRQLNWWLRYSTGHIPLAIDGKFGPNTEKEVRRYQKIRRKHIADHSVDGKVGVNSWNDLFNR